MQECTITVKARLSSEASVSEKQIRDALWYYYYDVDKTVAYLQREHFTFTDKLLLMLGSEPIFQHSEEAKGTKQI